MPSATPTSRCTVWWAAPVGPHTAGVWAPVSIIGAGAGTGIGKAAATALLVLAVCTVIDLGSVSAALSVVEPYSSGLGGGGFFLLHDARSGRDVFVDARETAPASAQPTTMSRW